MLACFFWLTVCALFFLLELIKPLTSLFLSCALGALFSACVRLFFIASPQIIIFIGVSTIAYIFLGILFHPTKSRARKLTKQNLIGAHGLTLETIAPGISGSVKVHNRVISAHADDMRILVKNTPIKVIQVNNNNVIVTRCSLT